MPIGLVSRTCFKPALEGGRIGAGYVGAPSGRIDYRRNATAAGFTG
jgi:hypothetical protein